MTTINLYSIYVLKICVPHMYCPHVMSFSNLEFSYCAKMIEITSIHKYIIGHYNCLVRITAWLLKPLMLHTSVMIIDLVSHSTYVVCVKFIHKWGDLQFKVDPNDRLFLSNFSWQFYLLTEPGDQTLTFRLISQHTTY